ncbi:DMSO/TMAO reductase YedYZ heme-binding membrane subunit [Paenibacillus sp. V4I9]|nr:DMSO/TMAO reductase YedYZ heme-binding membrane subunit [Paenibacillus sp. V4I9]
MGVIMGIIVGLIAFLILFLIFVLNFGILPRDIKELWVELGRNSPH